MTPRRWLRIAAACPRCEKRPAWRIPEHERERHMEDPPSLEVGSCGCPACGHVFTVTAAAYQRAA